MQVLNLDKALKTANLSAKKILVAVDSSGSVSPPARKQWVDLVATIPTSFEADFVQFSQVVKPLSDKPLIGGTDFSAIEEYARKGDYPDAVIVITDGYAMFTGEKPQDESKWVVFSEYANFKKPLLPNWLDLNKFVEEV